MIRILTGDCRDVLRTLPDESVHCVVTSPPYFGLRCYGHPDQIGLEPTPDAFVSEMVGVFREVRRVLRKDGTAWINLGDSYAGGGNGGGGSFAADRANWRIVPPRSGRRQSIGGLKPKDLIGVPWRMAFALQADGWYLRQDIIWSKKNPMPESVRDRCTKAHEYLFLLSKSERYFYDADAIKEAATADRPDMAENGLRTGTAYLNGNTDNSVKPSRSGNKERKPASARGVPCGHDETVGAVAGSIPWEGLTRNKRSVWEVATQPFSEAHFATFPPALIEPCILAGCPKGGTCLDPFGGAGTTGLVADRLQRDAILIELNPTYAEMARRRITGDAPLFVQEAAE